MTWTRFPHVWPFYDVCVCVLGWVGFVVGAVGMVWGVGVCVWWEGRGRGGVSLLITRHKTVERIDVPVIWDVIKHIEAIVPYLYMIPLWSALYMPI